MDITQIADTQAHHVQRTASHVDTACEAIHEYIQHEEQRNAALWERISACNAVFETLSKTSAVMLQNAEEANAKITSAYAAQELIINADTILRDIHETLPTLVRQDGIEKEKQIRRILDTLNTIGYQCGQIQTSPKPYKDVIDLYNRKIESMFDTLLKQKQSAGLQKRLHEIGKLKKQLQEMEQYKNEEPEAYSSKINTIDKIYITKYKYPFITALAGLAISLIILCIIYADIHNKKADLLILLDENNMIKRERSMLLSERDTLLKENDTIYSENSALLNKNTLMENEINDLKNQINTLKGSISNSQKVLAIRITDMQAGNADSNSQWITKPGKRLKASNIRYLNPVFTYESSIKSWAVFSVKVIKPDGSLLRNTSNAPQGFSFSRNMQIDKGRHSLELTGLGNSSISIYYPGTWKIELWYNGSRLYSGEIVLR